MHGYRTFLFASVADFHARARLEEAACLVLDVQLNGAGFDLKRQFSHSQPELPVIFITGSDTEETRYAMEQVGAAAYLPKPFASKALLDAINSVVRSRSSDCRVTALHG